MPHSGSTSTAGNIGANPNSEINQGPPMVSRNSMIGRLVDPNGKAVSGTAVILDSMIKTLTETLRGHNELHKDMNELIRR
jgi:hypothetical protein